MVVFRERYCFSSTKINCNSGCNLIGEQEAPQSNSFFTNFNHKKQTSMQKMYKNTIAAKFVKAFLLSMVVAFASMNAANAQVTVTGDAAGGSPYADLSAAISAINGVGTLTQPTTITLLTGNPQTAPNGGYLITATGSISNTLVISGAGSGSIVTAAVPTSNNVNDAIFKIVGGDYITITGFQMQEHATTPVITPASNNMTEYGIAIYAASTTNGAKNNTISNNTISLGATYTQSFGIFSTATFSSANAATVTAQVSVAGGENSNNTIIGNTISNVAFGISVVTQPATATFSETGWTIGQSGSANTITYVGNANITTAYTLLSTSVHGGIIVRNAVGNSIRYNNVTSGTISLAAIATNGIALSSSTTPAGVTYTNNLSNNTVSLNSSTNTSGALTGIDFGYGIATGTITGDNNTITFNQNSANVAQTGAMTGIKGAYTAASSSVSSNNITFNQTASVTATTTNSSSITGLTSPGGTTGTPTMNVLSNTILINRSNTAAATFTSTLSGAMVGISANTATTTVNVGSAGNGNTITIKEAIAGAGTTNYTSAITVIDANAGHATANVVANTINTTGSTVRSTGAMICVKPEATVTLLYNIKGNSAIIDRVAVSGSISFTTQTSSPSNVADTVSNNTITFTSLSGSTSATGISQLGGPSTSGVKSICNNTISISGTNTGTVTGLAWGYSGGATVKGNMITISSAGATVIGIGGTGTSAGSGYFVPSSGPGSGIPLYGGVSNNTLSLTSSATSPTSMIGITVAGAGPHKVFNNTFSTLTFSGIITSTPVVSGIACSAGTNDSIYNNIVTNITVGAATSTGNPTINGILISGSTTPYVFNNKIYGITSNCTGATGDVNGIRLSAGTTNTFVYNNLIGNLVAGASANPDGIRGISITSTTTSSTQNIMHNTIFLNGTSTGANFGGSGVFHTASATATTAALNLRNNIIINRMTPVGTGFVVALRRSGTALNNFTGTATNRNMLYAGTPGASKLIYYDGTNSDQTLSAYQARVSPVGVNSITGEATWIEGSGTPYETAGNFFQSLTGSSSNYLHIVGGITTLVESGGATISSPIAITQDYDGDTRGATPDLGADEFVGQSPAPTNSNFSTPANVCNSGDSRTVTVDATSPSGTSITGVTITYNNGSATGPVAMTNTSGNTWSYDIPAGTAGSTVTWSVSSTNDIGLSATGSGPSFVYLPLTGATASASAASSSVCSGSTTTLSASLSSSQTKTLSAGATTSSSTAASFFPGAWGGAKTQYIIKASELQALGLTAGNITSLAFEPTTSGQQYQGFYVHLAHTSLTAMTTAFVTTGLTQVYLGTEGTDNGYTPTANAVNTLAFGTGSGSSSSFNWDGTSNLLVQVSWSRVPANTTSTASTMKIDAAGFTSTAYRQADSESPATMLASTTATGTGSNRPNFRFTGNAAATITTYSWSDGISFTSSSATPTVTPSIGTNTYTVNLTAGGCTTSNSTTPASPSVVVTGNALPTAPTFDGTNPNQCGTVTYTVAGGTPGSTYKFYTVPTGGVAVATNTTGIYTNTTPIVGDFNTVYVSVTDVTTGCTSDRTQIDVFANTPLPLGISQSTVATCVGRYDSLSVTTGLSDYDVFTWAPTTNLFTNTSGTPYTGGNTTKVYYRRNTATASETITLSAVNTTSGSANDGCSNVASAIFTVNANPTIAAATATPSSVCSGSAVTLNGTTNVIGDGNKTIGAGASTSTSAGISMFYGGYGGVKTQYIIKASELTAAGIAAGNITSLGVDISSLGSPNTVLQGVAIDMNHTSLTALTSNIEVTTTNVYPAANFTPAIGINTFTFTTPFNWDGTSNILISFSYSNATTSNVVPTVKVDAPGFTSSNARYVDSRTAAEVYGYNGSALPSGWNGAATTGTSRPKFTISGQVQTTGAGTLNWVWNNGTSNVLSAANGTVNPTNTPAGSVDKTVTYTVTGTSASAPYCSGSLAASAVTVKSLAVAPTNTSLTPQCGTPTFTVTTGLSGFVTYKWYDAVSSGNLVATTTSSTGSSSYFYTGYTSGATNHLYVSVTAAGGCESARTDAAIYAQDPPALTINTADTVQTCVGNYNLINVTAGATSFDTYVWTANTNLFLNNTGTTYSGNPTTVYYKRNSSVSSEKITLTATNNTSGCVATAIVVFKVGANPVVSSATITPSTLCNRDTVTLTANGTVSATGTATLGAGGTTSTSAGGTFFPGSWGGAKTQYIVRASELADAGVVPGNITSLAFEGTTLGQEYQGFTVSLAHTNVTTAPTSTFINSNLVQVYKGTTGANQGYAPTIGVNTLAFGTGSGSTASFNWDGTSNLVVTMSWSKIPSATTSTVSGMKVDVVSFVSTAYRQRDSQTPDSLKNETVVNTTTSNRPKFIFGAQVGTNLTKNYNWTWSTTGAMGTAVVTGDTTKHSTVNNGSTPLSVTYTAIATDPTSGCYTALNGTAITVNPSPTAPTSATAATQCGLPTFTIDAVAGMTYKWYAASSGGIAIVGATSTSYTPATYTGGGATNTYWTTVTNTSGCESDRTAVSTVVNDPPAIAIQTSASTVCANNYATLNLTAGTAGSFTTVTWSPTTNLFTDMSGTPYTGGHAATVYYKRSTAVASEVITAIGTTSGGTVCINNATVAMTVNPNPNITSVTATPTSVCSGSNVALNGVTMGVSAGTVTVGAGASSVSSYNAPFYSLWSNKRMQIMFKAAELTSFGMYAGNITTVSFPTTSGTVSNKDYTLKMKLSTGVSDMSSFVSSGFTTVFTSTELIQTANTDNTFSLDAPFYWDGTSDVIVEMCWGDNTTTATLSSASPADATSYVSVIKNNFTTASSGSTICANATNSIVTYSVRPQVKFGAQTIANNAASFTWVWNTTLSGNSINNGSSTTHTPTNVTGSDVSGTYGVTVTNATTSCFSTATTSSVTVKPLPSAPTDNGTVASQCGLPTYIVATSASSPTINWYTVPTNGTAISAGSSLSYAYTGYTPNAVNTLYASVTQNGCESPRTAIAVTVASPAAIALNGTSTRNTCVDRIETISVSAATVGNYVNFNWAPTTNLYTDANATVAYNGTGNPTTIYYKRSSGGTEIITLTASNNGTGACVNTVKDTFNVNTNPVITSITATPTTVCSGSTVALNGKSFIPYTSNICEPTDASANLSSLSAYGMYFSSTNGARINTVDVYPSTAGTLIVQLRNGTTVVDTRNFTIVSGDVSTTVVKTLTLNFDIPAGSTGWNIYYPSVAINRGAGTYNYPYSNGKGFTITGNTLDGDNITGGSRLYFYNWNVTDTANLSSSYTWSWTTSHTGAAIANGSTTSHVVTNTTNAAVTADYTATVTNVSTTCVSTGNSNTITVNYIPAAPTNTTTANQCGTPTYNVTTSETGATINWHTQATGGSALSSGSTTSYVYATYPTYPSGNDTLWASVSKNGCESGRTMIVVAVSVPPALALTTASNVNTCVDRIETISVTGATAGNYNTFTWSPITNLYTDANATVAYSGTGNPTTVYYKRSSTSVSEAISVSATNGSGCLNVKSVSFVVNANPVITAATISSANICSGDALVLNAESFPSTTGTATLGLGTTTSTASAINPLYGGYGGVKTQYLIRKSELDSLGVKPGNITSLGFDISSTGATLDSLSINMANTPLTVLTTSIEVVPTVVRNAGQFIPISGINTLAFNTPFNWDGTSNIIISFCWSQNNTSNTSSTLRVNPTAYVTSNARYVDSRTYSVLYAYTGSTLPSGWNGSSTTNTSRPKFIFGGTVGTNYTPSLTWSWSNGVSTAQSTASGTLYPTNLTTAPTSATYAVTATDANTCSTTTSPTNATVTVNPGTVGGTPSSLIVCSGFQPSSNVSLVGSVGTIIKWQKSTDVTFATNVTDIVNTSTTLLATEIGTVSVPTYLRAVVKSGACSQMYSDIGTLTPVVTVGGTASSQTVCYTGSGTAPSNNIVLTGYQGSVVKWQKSTDSTFTTGVVDITSNSISLSGSAVGAINTTTYVRALVQNATCSQQYSRFGTLTAYDGQASTISISTTSSPICSGSNTVFHAVASNPGSTPVYVWKRNGNVVGTNSTSVSFASGVLQTNDQITCEVTSSNPCASPSLATSNTLTLTVLPSPAVGAIYNKRTGAQIVASSFCNFTDTLFVADNTINGTWSTSNSSVGSVTTYPNTANRYAYVLPTGRGATDITYTLASAGCASTSTFTLKVAPVAVPSTITAASSSVCVNSTLQLSSATTGGTWAIIYPNRATTSNTGLVTGRVAGTTPVRYTVANDSGCSNFTEFGLTVNALPAVPTINYAPGTVNPQAGAPAGGFCIGKKFNVVGIPTGGHWSYTNTGVATITDSLVSANNWWGNVSVYGIGSGNIVYTITNANGCSIARQISGNGVTCAGRGIDLNAETKPVFDFTLYPNPAKGRVSFNVEFADADGKVVLTDMYGKQIKTQSLSLGTNQIDINNLSKGFYLVSVINNDGTRTTKKLIVE